MACAPRSSTPCRLNGSWTSRPATKVGVVRVAVAGGTSRDIAVGGLAGVPADADAVVLNVTVTDTTASSYLSIWPAGQAQPTASSLNWTPGRTIPNAVTVKLGAGGKISIVQPVGQRRRDRRCGRLLRQGPR